MEKKKILNVFKINKKNELQILSIIKYFFNKTKMSNDIINHIFGAILIIINYNPKNMTAINEIFDDFCNLDNLLKNELIQQINIFKFNEYNDLYDSIIFDTFCFLKEFKKLEQGNIGFNILHEILYNLLPRFSIDLFSNITAVALLMPNILILSITNFLNLLRFLCWFQKSISG